MNKKIDHEALRASQSILNLLAYITAKLEIIFEQDGCNCVKSFLLFYICINKVFICFHVLKLKLLFNSFKNTTIANKTFLCKQNVSVFKTSTASSSSSFKIGAVLTGYLATSATAFAVPDFMALISVCGL